MNDVVMFLEFKEIAGGLVNVSVIPWPQMDRFEMIERLRWTADVLEQDRKLVRVK